MYMYMNMNMNIIQHAYRERHTACIQRDIRHAYREKVYNNVRTGKAVHFEDRKSSYYKEIEGEKSGHCQDLNSYNILVSLYCRQTIM